MRKIPVLILIIYVFGSCMTQKKAENLVLTNPASLEMVGREWEKTHPCVVENGEVKPGEILKIIPLINYVPVLAPIDRQHIIDSMIHEARVRAAKDSLNHEWNCSREINDAFDAGYSQARNEFAKVEDTVRAPDTVPQTDLRRLNICLDSMNYYKGLYQQEAAKNIQWERDRKSIGANLKYLALSIFSNFWFWVAMVLLAAYLTRKIWIPRIPGGWWIKTILSKLL